MAGLDRRRERRPADEAAALLKCTRRQVRRARTLLLQASDQLRALGVGLTGEHLFAAGALHARVADGGEPGRDRRFSEQSTFMGTDATEKWKKKEFMVWAKPFFNRGRAWSFKSVKRSLYMDSELPIAWFDELLSTQMKICRGSGVVAKEKNGWKIKQYVLSMTIPNTFSDSVVNIKAAVEDSLLQSFQQRK